MATNPPQSDGGSWEVAETTRILNHQLQEIRNQRNQALRVLRMQFAVAGVLVAALTAIASQSPSLNTTLRFTTEGIAGTISGPVMVIIGIYFTGRGVIGFFRGSYSALNVLSSRSVSSVPYWEMVKLVALSLLGREISVDPVQRPLIGPNVTDLRKAVLAEDSADGLVEQHLICIEENTDIIEENDEGLFRLYRKMAWGITAFGAGVLIIMFNLPVA